MDIPDRCFWLLVAFDLDYSLLGTDIIDDGIATLIGTIGLIIHLFGLNDLRRTIKYKDRAARPKSLFGALISHLFLGIGLFYVGSKSIRKWIYPVALLLILIGFADLDYSLFSIDIMPDETATILAVPASIVYISGFIDTWLVFRKYKKTNQQQLNDQEQKKLD